MMLTLHAKKMDIFSNDDELTLNYEATADCTFSVKGISGKINLKKGEKKLINFWPPDFVTQKN